MDGCGWGGARIQEQMGFEAPPRGPGGGGGGPEKLELLQSCELKHSHTPASFTVLMHQDVTKMCQIFKKPHTYTNASPRLCRPPKLRPSVSQGWGGAGLGSQHHHSGHLQPWVWTNCLAQKWPSGDGATPRKVRDATLGSLPGPLPHLLPGHCQLCRPRGPAQLSPSLSWVLLLFLPPAARGSPGPGALPETPRTHPPTTERKPRPERKETSSGPSPRPLLIYSTNQLSTPWHQHSSGHKGFCAGQTCRTCSALWQLKASGRDS